MFFGECVNIVARSFSQLHRTKTVDVSRNPRCSGSSQHHWWPSGFHFLPAPLYQDTLLCLLSFRTCCILTRLQQVNTFLTVFEDNKYNQKGPSYSYKLNQIVIFICKYLCITGICVMISTDILWGRGEYLTLALLLVPILVSVSVHLISLDCCFNQPRDKYPCQLAATFKGLHLWKTRACALSGSCSSTTWLKWLSGSELLATVAPKCFSPEEISRSSIKSLLRCKSCQPCAAPVFHQRISHRRQDPWCFVGSLVLQWCIWTCLDWIAAPWLFG